MEIERKYRVLRLPQHLERYSKRVIEQGYLCQNPIIRIRRSNEACILTYKAFPDEREYRSRTAKVMEELEVSLSLEGYGHLKAKTDGYLVYKTRYLIPLESGLTAELDVFEERLAGLVFVEVEFQDLLQAEEFAPPDWFGEDVSADRRFSNYYLSQQTPDVLELTGREISVPL